MRKANSDLKDLVAEMAAKIRELHSDEKDVKAELNQRNAELVQCRRSIRSLTAERNNLRKQAKCVFGVATHSHPLPCHVR